MIPHIETIVELQRALDRLQETERRLTEIPDWMRELHQQHATRKAEIAVSEQAAVEAAEERKAAEAAIQDAQEKLKKYQQQINLVTTQREYGALLQEMDTVKRLIAAGEEQGLAALEKAEKAQKSLAELRESFREVDEQYAAEAARWEGEKPGFAREADQFRTQIGTLRERLPRGIVALYERVRVRYGGAGLATVRKFERPGKAQFEWHCSSCNYRVRPQVVVEIRSATELVQCDGCKRILFLEEEPG